MLKMLKYAVMEVRVKSLVRPHESVLRLESKQHSHLVTPVPLWLLPVNLSVTARIPYPR